MSNSEWWREGKKILDRVWAEFTPLYLQAKNATKLFVGQCIARYFCWLPLCACVCAFFFCFSVLLSTLCRSVATAYHFPWSWFAWNRLFFHFHSNCKCCSILKNGQFYLDILCMLRMLRTRSLIRWMMAHLRLQLYCALRTLYFYD